MVGWHHRLDGHESELAPEVGDEQGVKESFGPRKKRKKQSQRPLLNHLTSEKTQQNFRSRPDAPGRLHLSETYHPLSGNLLPPTPA